jgi:hypothetical protein
MDPKSRSSPRIVNICPINETHWKGDLDIMSVVDGFLRTNSLTASRVAVQNIRAASLSGCMSLVSWLAGKALVLFVGYRDWFELESLHARNKVVQRFIPYWFVLVQGWNSRSLVAHGMWWCR